MRIRFPRSNQPGFTLMEMVVSLTISGVVLGAAVLGGTAFRTLFYAVDDYYQSTSDQMLVLDYIARDIRNAISGTVSNNGATLTVQVPDYVDPATNLPRTPTVTPTNVKSAGNVKYLASPTDSPLSITYAVSGNIVTRTEVSTRNGVVKTTSTAIANDIDSLQLVDASAGGATNFNFGPASTATGGAVQTVKTSVTFMPRFNRMLLAASRTGTTLSQTVVVRGN
jgi:prepilin-type N-terminal cleavage/methylation domain-containing protein